MTKYYTIIDESYKKLTQNNQVDLNNSYNNADSFAMSFDYAWKDYSQRHQEDSKNIDEKLDSVLLKIKDHPFLKKNPAEAKKIGLFRIRLLKLQ
mgnify:CR=1 FL=1|tara:strand:- start:1406 stop:1687 length:282 start_codon:yes stop_codon:yes gene_type:complete